MGLVRDLHLEAVMSFIPDEVVRISSSGIRHREPVAAGTLGPTDVEDRCERFGTITKDRPASPRRYPQIIGRAGGVVDTVMLHPSRGTRVRCAVEGNIAGDVLLGDGDLPRVLIVGSSERSDSIL